MCCSVHRHKMKYIFSDFKVIFGQHNSMSSGDCKESLNIFNFQNKVEFKHLKYQEKTQNSIKFPQNWLFPTFLIWVVKFSNKHFCKLDKIPRNFWSWQLFAFETVYEICGFEVCHFNQWSCDILNATVVNKVEIRRRTLKIIFFMHA